MIVIDIGCYAHGNSQFDSVGALCRKFRPDVLFGFDPLTLDAVAVHPETGTLVITRRAAANTFNGEDTFTEAGTQSAMGTKTATPSTHPAQEPRPTDCFDLAAFIFALPKVPLVVKIDVEGYELPLMRHLHKTKADERIHLLLVEEHPHLGLPPLPKVTCPVEEWWM